MNPVGTALRILPALPELAPARGGGSGTGAAGAPAGSFSATLQDAMAEVDGSQTRAEGVVRGVLEGTGGDVHKAVFAVKKANLSFQLMLQVMNKLIAAYPQVGRLTFYGRCSSLTPSPNASSLTTLN